jgi:ribonuclease J
MRTSVEIARELKYIEVPKDTIISAEESNKLPPSKVLILCTGAQAEEQAVLMRIVSKEHRSLEIQPGDAVVFSSSAIPGNERAIGNLKDYLARQGADVYHNQMMDVHSSGHACQEDLKAMLRLVKPEFFIPAYGDFYHRKIHGKLAEETGIPNDHVLYADNGHVIEVRPHDVRITKERYPVNYIMVDGLGVGDLSEVVIRDRQILASDGMVVAIIKMVHRTGELIGKPDIVSRGFVYMKEQRALIGEVEQKIRDILKKTQQKNGSASPPNEAYIKAKLRDDLGQFLYTKTQRRPMIIPLLIEV